MKVCRRCKAENEDYKVRCGNCGQVMSGRGEYAMKDGPEVVVQGSIEDYRRAVASGEVEVESEDAFGWLDETEKEPTPESEPTTRKVSLSELHKVSGLKEFSKYIDVLKEDGEAGDMLKRLGQAPPSSILSGGEAPLSSAYVEEKPAPASRADTRRVAARPPAEPVAQAHAAPVAAPPPARRGPPGTSTGRYPKPDAPSAPAPPHARDAHPPRAAGPEEAPAERVSGRLAKPPPRIPGGPPPPPREEAPAVAGEDPLAPTAPPAQRTASGRLPRPHAAPPAWPVAGVALVCDLFGEPLPLDPAHRYLIGRQAGANIRLDAATVSRRHAGLSFDEKSELWIEDLRSINGTYVNGCAIQRRRLRDGDHIDVGPFHLEVVAGRPAHSGAADANADTRVLRALPGTLTGDIEANGIVPILALLHVSRRSGVLTLRADRQVGRVFLVKGEILSAFLGKSQGDAALDALLGAHMGSLHFTDELLKINRTVTRSTEAVLAAALERSAASRSGPGSSPPPSPG